jgi:hypothetical protein
MNPYEVLGLERNCTDGDIDEESTPMIESDVEIEEDDGG